MTDLCKNPGNCKVILVEDDPVLAMVTALQMRAAGIKFCQAADGNQALSLIKSHRPRVLMLDVALPGMNGFEIVEALRQDPSFADLFTMKVIIYSSQDLNAQERERLSLAGRTMFFTKSIKDDNMGNTVRQLLAEDD